MARKTQGLPFLDFCERYGRHPDGELIGQRLRVHPWWQQTFLELLEWELDAATGLWRRRYSEAYISVPKGQGKTTMLAHLALFMLLADRDPNTGELNGAPLVVSAAASEEQSANLLFGAAKTICELNPDLGALVEVFDKEIIVRNLPRARMKNVATKAATQDGANASLVLCDELHQWSGQRGFDLYSILQGAISKRRNGLMVSITTAGWDESSVCFEKYTYGQKVQRGELDDPRFYFRVVEAAPEADHRDPKVWAEANPLLGESVQPAYLADRVKRERESAFRRFHLNQWVTAEDVWLEAGEWDSLRDETGELDLDPSRPLFVAVDVAKTIDSSAVAMVQQLGTADQPLYFVKAATWTNPYREDDPRYGEWRHNNAEVMAFLRQLFVRFPVSAGDVDRERKPGPLVLFDPWRFRAEAEALIAEGINCQEYPQSDARMVPACLALQDVIKNKTLRHDGDADLRRHVLSATAEAKPRGFRLSKPVKSKRRIDACIALAIALWGCQSAPAPKPSESVYESRDLLVL